MRANARSTALSIKLRKITQEKNRLQCRVLPKPCERGYNNSQLLVYVVRLVIALHYLINHNIVISSNRQQKQWEQEEYGFRKYKFPIL